MGFDTRQVLGPDRDFGGRDGPSCVDLCREAEAIGVRDPG